MKKLAIVITHPIQYYAPWFKLLAERNKVELRVFYTWSQSKEVVRDRTFGRNIKWDVPLLEGYDYEFVENISKKPGSHHFFGINNPGLKKALLKFDPSAILFFGWNFKSHLLAMRYFKGKVPVWFRGDSTLLDEDGGFKTKLRRYVLKKVYCYVDKAFYVGKANKAYFLKHDLNQNQLVYAPHAINNDYFSNTALNNYGNLAEEWKRDLGILKEQITVVFAGKFETKKQPDLLLNAIIRVNQNRKVPVALLMIGNGPLEVSLKEMAKDYDFIKFLPFQNQSKMPLIYRMASVFCLPSKGPGETWGLAVNESMACSTPVIVTDKVGCEEDLIIEGYNGFVFNHSNIDELITILNNLSLPSLKVMGSNALKYIDNFTFSHIVETLEKNIKLI